MKWGDIFKVESKKNIFSRAFTAKYKLETNLEHQQAHISLKSRYEIRWQMQVENITEEYADLNLITLERKLIETNNSSFQDFSDLGNIFSYMLDELELTLDSRGQIIKIKNLAFIRSKWKEVKKKLEKTLQENPKFSTVISLNDKLYEEAESIKNLLQNSEFFINYFHPFWGLDYPVTISHIAKDNLFHSHKIKWDFQAYCSSEPQINNSEKIIIEGEPLTNFNREWKEKAYNAFTELPAKELAPEFIDRAVYYITPYGKILNAEIKKSEIVLASRLYSKLEYKLNSEEETEEETE